MGKSLQIRLSDDEHRLIRAAFQGENLSKVVRDFLLAETERRLESIDLSLQDDSALKAFLEALSSPGVQQALFNVFKKVR